MSRKTSTIYAMRKVVGLADFILLLYLSGNG